ncbi:MAG: GtrA family protein [bacterium]|nr:GtrA family protein [bacterium]
MKRNKEGLIHPRMIRFGLVGLSGVLVNMGFLYLFTELFGLNYKISSVIAIEISILTNFLLNDRWTWSDRAKERFMVRMARYHVTAGLTAFIFNWGLLVLLTEFFHIYYFISNIIGIGFGMLSNYILNNLWTFREHPPGNKGSGSGLT